jgi:D-glycero-alpha-D-manno-heptose-7-phosphate kinase
MKQTKSLRKLLEKAPLTASAPCRIDVGGTLDIASFLYPLYRRAPCTFNIALNLRTRVRLTAYQDGMVRISSRGFQSQTFAPGQAPFDHPLGLMFAIVEHFGVSGVHIDIDSASPPRSAMGGSSVAAAALVAALMTVTVPVPPPVNTAFKRKVANLAHALEESVAGVLCGRQDHLAALFGGVNCWYWHPEIRHGGFEKRAVIKKTALHKLENHLVVAYCGIPHESKQINAAWIQQFIQGRNRDLWVDIVSSTKKFVDALKSSNYKEAARWVNNEAALRRRITPEVFDEMGVQLSAAGRKTDCGVRFAGAGGGGCVWAIGEAKDIDRLRILWEDLLEKRDDACMLNTGIDPDGLRLCAGDPA